jgi:Thiamine pyrophosphate enzyme, N-terminal TPP binding domain
LQQLESTSSQDVSVNDCFRPVSRYWDRMQRPEHILTALPEAMRVLTSPAETGAVTLALPQDVQAEAYDYPDEFSSAGFGPLPGLAPTWNPCREICLLPAGSTQTVSSAIVINIQRTRSSRTLRRRFGSTS